MHDASGVEHADKMADKLWLHRTGTQYTIPLTTHVPNDHEGIVPAITVGLVSLRQQNSNIIVHLCRCWIFLRLTRLKNPKSSGKRRTMSKGVLLDPDEANIASQKEIQ